MSPGMPQCTSILHTALFRQVFCFSVPHNKFLQGGWLGPKECAFQGCLPTSPCCPEGVLIYTLLCWGKGASSVDLSQPGGHSIRPASSFQATQGTCGPVDDGVGTVGRPRDKTSCGSLAPSGHCAHGSETRRLEGAAQLVHSPHPRTSPQGVQPQSLSSRKLAVYTLGRVLH